MLVLDDVWWLFALFLGVLTCLKDVFGLLRLVLYYECPNTSTLEMLLGWSFDYMIDYAWVCDVLLFVYLFAHPIICYWSLNARKDWPTTGNYDLFLMVVWSSVDDVWFFVFLIAFCMHERTANDLKWLVVDDWFCVALFLCFCIHERPAKNWKL